MDYTQQEILSQFDSCSKTIEYMMAKEKEIRDAFSGAGRVIFIGSGSSYCVAKSAARILRLKTNVDSMAVAAGDLLLNYDKYKGCIDGSLLVCLSRSGNTSELLLSVKRAVNDFKPTCISVCMRENSELSKICGLNMTLNWAFDRSVCQTQSVTNLYLACLLMAILASGDLDIVEDLRKIMRNGLDFYERNESLYRSIADMNWNSAIVLADCEIAGLAEEGSLVFKEISRIQSNHYCVLDVRHGPVVIIDSGTLVILVADVVNQYVFDLVKDIKSKGAYVITMSMLDEAMGADAHIYLPGTHYISVAAIYTIFSLQMIALYKAKNMGFNPDLPEGLNACILLE